MRIWFVSFVFISSVFAFACSEKSAKQAPDAAQPSLDSALPIAPDAAPNPLETHPPDGLIGASDAPPSCSTSPDGGCPRCSSTTGLRDPVVPCSAQYPCERLLATYAVLGVKVIKTSSDPPICKSQIPKATLTLTGCARGGRGDFDDTKTGSPRTYTDSDGTIRYFCEGRPARNSLARPYPLLIYVPGSGGSAGDMYDMTLLRAKAETFELASGMPGFILVGSQGRNLHWPTVAEQDGTKHDSYHRSFSSNRDVAFFDHIIDSLVAEGVVDPRRIYLTGWSNGARFAAFYGIGRHEVSTPGGNRVAAVAVYSGGDPFENITPTESPSCKADTYPQSTLPYYLVSRNCDAVACDQAQFDALQNAGWEMTPGNQATGWIGDLLGRVKTPTATWLKIGYTGTVIDTCLPTAGVLLPCTQKMAQRNHFCWPDGVADQGGNDHETAMLTFLRENPLPL